MVKDRKCVFSLYLLIFTKITSNSPHMRVYSSAWSADHETHVWVYKLPPKLNVHETVMREPGGGIGEGRSAGPSVVWRKPGSHLDLEFAGHDMAEVQKAKACSKGHYAAFAVSSSPLRWREKVKSENTL